MIKYLRENFPFAVFFVLIGTLLFANSFHLGFSQYHSQLFDEIHSPLGQLKPSGIILKTATFLSGNVEKSDIGFYRLSNLLAVVFALLSLLVFGYLAKNIIGKYFGKFLLVLVLLIPPIASLTSFNLGISTLVMLLTLQMAMVIRYGEKPSALVLIGLLLVQTLSLLENPQAWIYLLGIDMGAAAAFRKKPIWIIPLTLAISFAVSYIPHVVNGTAENYLSLAFEGNSVVSDEIKRMIPSNEIGFLYLPKLLVYSISPMILLAMLGLPFAYLKLETYEKRYIQFLGIAFVVPFLFLLLKPQFLLHGVESLAFLYFLIIFLSAFAIKFIFTINGARITYIVVGFALIAGSTMELNKLLQLDMLNYNYKNILSGGFKETFISSETDYNLFHSYKELADYSSNLPAGDSIMTNFCQFIPGQSLNYIYSHFENRHHHPGAHKLFDRFSLSAAHKRSPSFASTMDKFTANLNGINYLIEFPTNDSIALGFQFIQTGNYGKAITYLRRLSEQFPNEETTFYGVARAQYYFGSWDNSLPYLQTAIQLNPEYAQAHCLMGELLEKQNKQEAAMEKYEFVTRLRPNLLRPFQMLVNNYLRNKEFALAQVWIDSLATKGKIGALKAKNFENYLNLAAKSQGQLESELFNQFDNLAQMEDNQIKAIEALRLKADSLMNWDSANPQLYTLKGMCRMYEERLREASICFEQAVQINPNFIEQRKYLAIARTNLGAEKYLEDSLYAALFHFKYALDYDPKNQDIKQNIAAVYTKMGDKASDTSNFGEALEFYKMAFEMDESYAPTHLSIGNLALKHGNVEEAEKAFYKAHVLDKTLQEPIVELLKIYTSIKDEQKATIYAKKLQQLEAKNRDK